MQLNSASAISNEANAAVERMGKTLAQEDVSFKAKTMRVYQDSDGDYLHMVHNMDVLAARPDKMAVTATGDDDIRSFSTTASGFPFSMRSTTNMPRFL